MRLIAFFTSFFYIFFSIQVKWTFTEHPIGCWIDFFLKQPLITKCCVHYHRRTKDKTALIYLWMTLKQSKLVLSLKTIFWANLISKFKNSHLETTLIHTVHTVHSYRVTHVFFSLISTRRFREVSHATVASYKIFSTFGNSSKKKDLQLNC